jgi:hypothetical protein
MRKKFFFFQVTVAILLLAFSFTAQAAKPVVWSDEFPDLFVLAECDGFDVMDDTYNFVSGKDFFDKDGNWIRTQMHWKALDYLYSSKYPEGLILTGTASVMVRFWAGENGEDFQSVQGLNIGIIVPGYGPLFYEAGKIVFDWNGPEVVFAAGKHKDWNFGEIEALCNYFDQD